MNRKGLKLTSLIAISSLAGFALASCNSTSNSTNTSSSTSGSSETTSTSTTTGTASTSDTTALNQTKATGLAPVSTLATIDTSILTTEATDSLMEVSEDTILSGVINNGVNITTAKMVAFL